ncbi:hypothetical protein LZ30DRAFT_765321 [Colletotrichum cereale]|nr:hypothetical protein LZ30DRAFT_765321 [Colletotrichum cereale]
MSHTERHILPRLWRPCPGSGSASALAPDCVSLETDPGGRGGVEGAGSVGITQTCNYRAWRNPKMLGGPRSILSGTVRYLAAQLCADTVCKQVPTYLGGRIFRIPTTRCRCSNQQKKQQQQQQQTSIGVHGWFEFHLRVDCSIEACNLPPQVPVPCVLCPSVYPWQLQRLT